MYVCFRIVISRCTALTHDNKLSMVAVDIVRVFPCMRMKRMNSNVSIKIRVTNRRICRSISPRPFSKKEFAICPRFREVKKRLYHSWFCFFFFLLPKYWNIHYIINIIIIIITCSQAMDITVGSRQEPVQPGRHVREHERPHRLWRVALLRGHSVGWVLPPISFDTYSNTIRAEIWIPVESLTARK